MYSTRTNKMLTVLLAFVVVVNAQHQPPYSTGIFKPPPPSPPPPPYPSPPPSPPPATPNGLDVCFTGSGGTTGVPYDSQGCPIGSCISTITVTPSNFNDEPVFSGLIATCTDGVTKRQSTFLIPAWTYNPNAPTTSITVRNGLCFTGISASVVINPADNGLYVSTITTNEDPPQSLGYVANANPYNLPERFLGKVSCAPGSYLTTIFGRSGLILDELCFVCNSLLQSPPPILVPSSPPPLLPPTLLSNSPPPPSQDILEVQIGPGVSYTASSTVLSANLVSTTVTDINRILVFTMYFLTNSSTITALLPDNTGLILNTPELLGLNIDSSTIYAFNTVATYVASQVVFAIANPGSNASRRKLLNGLHPGDDQQDHPGCDDFIDTACTIGCCAQHDKCYHDNNCSASSWKPDTIDTSILPPIIIPPSGTCALDCNAKVVGCLLTSSIPCAAACIGCIAEPEIAPICNTKLPSTGSSSCYDHTCDEFYDCSDGCPICPIPYLTPSPPQGCCNCNSVCLPPPTCEYACQCGNVETFHSQDDLIDFCTGGDFGSVCCSCAAGFGYAFCVVFGRAGCALTVGCE